MKQIRIFSGINPSSAKGLHLGNYLGAVKQHVALQEQNADCFYFIANLHSLNTLYDPKQVEENTFNTYLEYLSLGLDPDKCTFFVESDIPAIPYLQTIINNVINVNDLKRAHAYKDKLAKNDSTENISMGLFSYPVLMAADILVFQADVVPVGIDQAQHVEIARDLATSFNQRYGKILKVPELKVSATAAKIIGIDGERKMSKSLGNDLPIFAAESVIKTQIRKITTDPARIKPTDPGDPKKNPCFNYLRLLDYPGAEIAAMEAQYREGTIGDVKIKDLLFEVFMDYFAAFRAKKLELEKNPESIQELRRKNAEKANKIANENLAIIKKAIGV